MKWFDKVERKLGRYAIPNLMRYMVIVSIIGSVLGLVVPGFYEMYLSLNVYAILHGQVWRIVTFLFYPYVSIGSGGALINMIFFGIMLYVYYWIGNMLEQIWGRFRFNAFYFTGILLILIMTFGYYFVVCHANGQALAPQIGFGLANQIDLSDLNLSMFLAFAFCRDCAICADGRLSWIYADAFDRGSASGFCDLLCDCKRTTSGNAYETGEKTPRHLQKYGAAGRAAKT